MVSTSLPADIVVRSKPEKKGTFAYRALLLFSVLYFGRPEDFIRVLGFVPMAKITGGLALIALIAGLGSRSTTKKFPIELKLLTALFVWECLTVPFAFYKMGALNYVTGLCSKTLITAALITLSVTSLERLRKLMFVEAAAVAVMTVFSILEYKGGRMGGVLGGVFDNPNDLAIAMAMNWPLCLMFMLRTKNPIKKLLWGLSLLVMIRGLMLTYSRTGFLALGTAIVFCLIEFGIRGKRHYLLAIAFAAVLLAVIFSPTGYGQRVGSIFGKPLAADDSQEEREELLKKSLWVTARHPLLGVGPGNFASSTQLWRVTHNTYTELSSECGIPALIIFLFILRATFRNLRRVRESQLFAQNLDARLITGGLWASLAGYVVGAFFASTAYELFPYFLVGFTTALFNVANPGNGIPSQQGSRLQVWKPDPQLTKATW
jgi:O-antigen ligase